MSETSNKVQLVPKRYPVSISGTIQRVIDKITGDTMEEVPEAAISPSTKTKVGAAIDNALADPTNPIGWVSQNLIPAALLVTPVASGIKTIPTAIGRKLFGKAGTGSLMSKLRTLASMPRKDLAKKLGQEVVKGGISLGVDTAVDAASRATTGKTVGEHTANVLSTATGIDFPTWVGDLVSPTQWLGYGSLNKIEREVLPFLPGRYKPLPDYMKVENNLTEPITTKYGNVLHPTQESIDFMSENMPDYKQYITIPEDAYIEYNGVVKPLQFSKESKRNAKEMMKKLKREGAYVPWNFRLTNDLYEWIPVDYKIQSASGKLFPIDYGDNRANGANFTDENIKFVQKKPKSNQKSFKF